MRPDVEVVRKSSAPASRTLMMKSSSGSRSETPGPATTTMRRPVASVRSRRSRTRSNEPRTYEMTMTSGSSLRTSFTKVRRMARDTTSYDESRRRATTSSAPASAAWECTTRTRRKDPVAGRDERWAALPPAAARAMRGDGKSTTSPDDRRDISSRLRMGADCVFVCDRSASRRSVPQSADRDPWLCFVGTIAPMYGCDEAIFRGAAAVRRLGSWPVLTAVSVVVLVSGLLVVVSIRRR